MEIIHIDSNDNNPENVVDHEDEGIEQDHDPDVFRRTLTCKKVLQVRAQHCGWVKIFKWLIECVWKIILSKECEERLSKRSEAESHYKAVCRALVRTTDH